MRKPAKKRGKKATFSFFRLFIFAFSLIIFSFLLTIAIQKVFAANGWPNPPVISQQVPSGLPTCATSAGQTMSAVTFNWNNYTGADHFVVSVASGNSFGVTNYVFTTPLTSTSTSANGGTTGQTWNDPNNTTLMSGGALRLYPGMYVWKVTAYSTVGSTPFVDSNVVSFTVPPCTTSPNTPVNPIDSSYPSAASPLQCIVVDYSLNSNTTTYKPNGPAGGKLTASTYSWAVPSPAPTNYTVYVSTGAFTVANNVLTKPAVYVNSPATPTGTTSSIGANGGSWVNTGSNFFNTYYGIVYSPNTTYHWVVDANYGSYHIYSNDTSFTTGPACSADLAIDAKMDNTITNNTIQGVPLGGSIVFKVRVANHGNMPAPMNDAQLNNGSGGNYRIPLVVWRSYNNWGNGLDNPIGALEGKSQCYFVSPSGSYSSGTFNNIQNVALQTGVYDLGADSNSYLGQYFPYYQYDNWKYLGPGGNTYKVAPNINYWDGYTVIKDINNPSDVAITNKSAPTVVDGTTAGLLPGAWIEYSITVPVVNLGGTIQMHFQVDPSCFNPYEMTNPTPLYNNATSMSGCSGYSWNLFNTTPGPTYDTVDNIQAKPNQPDTWCDNYKEASYTVNLPGYFTTTGGDVGTTKSLKMSLVSQSSPPQAFADYSVVANTITNTSNSIILINIASGGAGYTCNNIFTNPCTVSISGGGGSNAQAVASSDGNAITQVLVTNGGSGYTSNPTISITTPGGSGASFTPVINGNAKLSNAGWSQNLYPANTPIVSGDQTPSSVYTYMQARLLPAAKAAGNNYCDNTTAGTPLAAIPPTSSGQSPGKFYYCSNNFNLNTGATSWTAPAGNTVIFVDGDLNISAQGPTTGSIKVNPSDTLVFIVKGNIFVSKLVSEIDGVYITGGSANISNPQQYGFNDDQIYLDINGNPFPLTVKGAIYGPINLTRYPTVTANTPAGENINYDPKYMAIITNIIGTAPTSWQEVAP